MAHIQPCYVPIIFDAPSPQMEVVRTITPPVARRNQIVYVTYTVTNTGIRTATDVTLTERLSSAPAQLGTLAPGETTRYSFAFAMGTQDFTSSASLSWHCGFEDSEARLEDAVIRYGNVPLWAQLTADARGGMEGETIRLCLTLQNRGRQEITGITATDPLLGELFTDMCVPAGDTVRLERELTLTESCNLLLTVSGTAADGSSIVTGTEMLHLVAISPTDRLLLSVHSSADREVIRTLPAVVRFTVTVSNPGNVIAPNVTVRSNGITLYPYDPNSSGVTLEPGESITFTREVLVDYPGRFRFDADTRNQLDQDVIFEGIPVQIFYSTDAYATDAPEVSVTLSPSSLAAPGAVTATIRVTNASYSPMIGPCALYGPDGQQLSAFGAPTLAPRETVGWSGTLNVTRAQLERGRISFILMYTVPDENGSPSFQTAGFHADVSHTEASAP